MSEQQSLFGRKLHADLEIEDELWEAAEDLRGTVAPADYKHYVLPLPKNAGTSWSRRSRSRTASTRPPTSTTPWNTGVRGPF
jgi:hypothetical protein